MDLSAAAAMVCSLTFLEQTGSTNADLAKSGGDDLTVLVAGSQTAGRGRAGREWSSPVGQSLAVSVLLKPGFANPDSYAWLPLLAGVAMARAVRSLGVSASVKWPNDVLVGGKKISGVLSELVDSQSVVVGAGLNLTQTQDELPIPKATSLRLEGAQVPLAIALERYLAEFVPLYKEFVSSGGNAEFHLRDAVKAICSTIGQEVQAMLPGEQEVVGTAIDIDATGRLLLAVEGENTLYAVGAGDIVHLRHN